MSDEKNSAWWPCSCGDHHQGVPRHAGALTGAGLVMHAPLPDTYQRPTRVRPPDGV